MTDPGCAGTMQSRPKVTVVMPVYNGERFLAQAIESILSQTFPDFEFIIVNDDSVDKSKDIILSYNDKRIKLIDNTNHTNLVNALNRGILAARGMYIARMDCDDVSLSKRLERQVSCLDDNKDIGVLGCGVIVIDAEGVPRRRVKFPEQHEAIWWELLFNSPFAHPSVMMRGDLVRSVGGYREIAHAEDYDLWLRIRNRARLHNLKDVLLLLRKHDQNVCRVNETIHMENVVRVSHGAICEILGDNVGLESVRRAAYGMVTRGGHVDDGMLLVWHLYSKTVMHIESDKVKKAIRQQAATRMILLWLRAPYGLRSYRFALLAMRLDPLVGLRVAWHFTQRVINYLRFKGESVLKGVKALRTDGDAERQMGACVNRGGRAIGIGRDAREE